MLTSAFENSGILSLRINAKKNLIMQKAVKNAVNLEELDIELDTYGSSTGSYSEIAAGCVSLITAIIASPWTYNSSVGYRGNFIGSFTNAFNGCSSLIGLTIAGSSIDSSASVTDALTSCTAIDQISISGSFINAIIALPKTMYLDGTAVTEIHGASYTKNYIYTATAA